MSTGISITELRQRLFQLADHVAETGEPLLIERRGVRLRLVREDAALEQGGRLARIKPRRRSVVIGAPLDPHESPARWTAATFAAMAEPASPAWHDKSTPRKRRKRP